jgi:hypothetical protein
VGKLAYDPIAMPWGEHCPFVVTAMKEINESYCLLSKRNRIHLPLVVAETTQSLIIIIPPLSLARNSPGWQ